MPHHQPTHNERVTTAALRHREFDPPPSAERGTISGHTEIEPRPPAVESRRRFDD